MIAKIRTSRLRKHIILFIFLLTFQSSTSSPSSSSPTSSSSPHDPPSFPAAPQLPSHIPPTPHIFNVPRGSSIIIPFADLFTTEFPTKEHPNHHTSHNVIYNHQLDYCLVDVEEDEEWLRVGNVLPKVSSCSMKHIEYVHNGNPYKKMETVFLNIYTTRNNINNHIRIKLIFNIIVSKELIFHDRTSAGLHDITSLSQLGDGHLKFNPVNGDICFIRASLNSHFTLSNPFIKHHEPHNSHHREHSEKQHDNLIYNCQLFSKLQLQLKTQGRFGINLGAEIIKNDTTQTQIIEQDYLEINSQDEISNNHPPQLVLRTSKKYSHNLTINAESHIHFPGYLMQLSDDTTLTKDIILSTNLTKISDIIYFSLRDDQTTPITSFIFEDVLKSNVLMNSKHPKFSPSEIIYIQIIAIDYYHAISQPIILRVKVVSKTPRQEVKSATVVAQQYIPTNILKQALGHLVNKERISFQISSAAQYGSLLFTNGNHKEFNLEDVKENRVLYVHNDTNILSDKIIIQVIADRKTSKLVLSIKVLRPVDVAAAKITHNKWIFIQEPSHQLNIKQFDARISEIEQENDKINFKIISPLLYGNFFLKTQGLERGILITSFTRYHLKYGLIYYDLNNPVSEIKQEVVKIEAHTKFSTFTQTFSFEFIVKDSDKKNGESILRNCGKKSIEPIIIDDQHPVPITSKLLCYLSIIEPSINPTFHITTFPFISGPNLLKDGGKIKMTVHNIGGKKYEKINSDKIMVSAQSIKEVDTFTQAMINQSSIYFMPRFRFEDNEEADVNGKQIILKYAVILEDELIHDTLVFTMPPQNLTSHVFLRIGMTTTLTEHLKSLKLPPTQTFKLTTNPHSGVLAKGGQVMKMDQSWTLGKLISDNVWFQHSRKTCSKDVILFDLGRLFFKLDILAMEHHDVQTIQLNVDLLGTRSLTYIDGNNNNNNNNNNNDDNNNLKNSQINHINEILKNSDILIQPKYGRLMHINPSLNFKAKDMMEGKIIYEPSHPSKPIKSDNFVLFARRDDANDVSTSKCWFSILNVTLAFKNVYSSPLKLLIKKELKVDGLKNSVMNHEIMQSMNDNSQDNLNKPGVIYVVHQSPVWGRIIKSKPHEKVRSFTDEDLTSRLIHYELGNLRGRTGISSLTDSALIYATDGFRNSTLERLNINITMLKSAIKKRSFRHLHKQQQSKNKKRYINKQHNYPRRVFNADRRRNNFGLKVRDIKVKRGGKHKFIVTFKKPSKKRRSMSETRLILEKPPSHGKLVVLNKLLPKSLVKNFGEDLQMDDNNFENINLLDISNEVPMIYEHDGSRTNSDNFILTLSNDVKTIKQGVAVKISSKAKVDLQPDEILTAPLLLHEDVPIVVSVDHLSVRASKVASSDVEFELVKLPSHGYIKVLDQNIRPANQEQVRLHETFSLTDVIKNKVIFVPLTAAIHNDSFDIKINADVPVIRIDVLSQNIPMETHSFVLKSRNISSGCLSEEVFKRLALDDQELKCTLLSLTKYPDYGRLVRTMFNGEDLKLGRICYQGISLVDYPDNFQLSVNNCINRTIALLKFDIHYEAQIVESISPKLHVNVPLMVTHGNSAFLTKANLYTSQANTNPSDIIYKIFDQPKHGILLLDDQPCHRFSQNDVNNDKVAYKSNKVDDSMIDYFLFNVDRVKMQNSTDKGTKSEVKSLFFSILIQPAVKPTPKFLINPSHSNLASSHNEHWLPFNSSHLKAINLETFNQDIIYHIKVRPKHGRLENAVSGRVMRNRFSQKDLDENKLRYVLKERVRGHNDSIILKVNDRNKTIVDNQKITFEWALMEFQKTFFKLCLSSQLITVPITRRGNIDEPCSARINLMPGSAIENVDFIKMSNDIVNFAAGQPKADWVLKVLDGGQALHRKHLTLRLTNASNALIGLKSRAFMEIIDKKDEFCFKRKIKKSSADSMMTQINYGDNKKRFKVDGDDDDEDELLETDLSFYNEKQRRRDSEREMNDYSSNIPRPCTPSTKSLLYFHQSLQQMFMCDGRIWVRWTNIEAGNKERTVVKNHKTCPLGWELYGDHCFLASKARHSWLRGEKMCRRDGGHLTFVSSHEHLQWLSTLTQGSRFWTGLNNRRLAGRWDSVGHHHAVNYIKWSPQQTCHNCRRHRCVQANERLEFEKRHCSRSHSRFVCVKAARLLRTSRKAVKGHRRRLNRRYKMT